jgi:hypothetical protein
MKKSKLPDHVLMEEEIEFGKVFAPVDTDSLVGQTGSVNRPFSQAEILESLPIADRKEVKKAAQKGFHPVLLLDLETGLAAIEMRKSTPSMGITAEQIRLGRLWSAVHKAQRRLAVSIIRLNDEERRHAAEEARRG